MTGFQGNFTTLLPVAIFDTATVAQSGTVSIPVSTNDAPMAGTLDLTSVTIVSAPAHGTATANSDGTVFYVNNGTAFWDGSGFNSSTEDFLMATTTDNWATWALSFPQTGTFTVRARATDAAGNSTITSGSVMVS